MCLKLYLLIFLGAMDIEPTELALLFTDPDKANLGQELDVIHKMPYPLSVDVESIDSDLVEDELCKSQSVLLEFVSMYWKGQGQELELYYTVIVSNGDLHLPMKYFLLGKCVEIDAMIEKFLSYIRQSKVLLTIFSFFSFSSRPPLILCREGELVSEMPNH